MLQEELLYARPLDVRDISECFFYHKMDLPGHGTVGGQWDLRGGEDDYLGHVDFNGRRVLEPGTASGFLYRHMHSKGAEVVAFDLSPEGSWDLVPFARVDLESLRAKMKDSIRQLNRGWWFANKVCGVEGKVVYGDIYNIPTAIGGVDISVFGMILLHLRDPFKALYNAARLTRETMIVTEIHPDQPEDAGIGSVVWDGSFREKRMSRTPLLHVMPSHHNLHPGAPVTWWTFSPDAICQMLGVFGFEKTVVTEHWPIFRGKKSRVFTVVGTRTCKSQDDLY